MMWYERSDLTESDADRREFLRGAFNLYGPTGSPGTTNALAALAGYVAGRAFYGWNR